MRAIVWHGSGDVRCETVPDPAIVDHTDAIVRITSTCICGSDLHLYDGYMPTMEPGDVIGHEPMGVVEEVGSAVTKLKPGDRVVVPFTISCGQCWFCQHGFYASCDTSNKNAAMAEMVMGHSPAALFGYSHMMGGFPGGQAEYLRVPYADVGPVKVPDGLPDEQVVFLSDVYPTGYMAAENAEIESGDTVAIWGCGPVGQFAIRAAWMFGAGRVIAIDRVAERLAMAEAADAETLNFDNVDIYDALQEMTKGRGPDRAIDAVGSEAHVHGIGGVYDKVKQQTRMENDRPHVFREALKCVRKAGTLSVPGVYIGYADKIPLGTMMNKGITIKTGQTHMQRYTEPLLQKIVDGQIDPSFVITHTGSLEDAPDLYRKFRDKEDGCIKVVLKPGATGAGATANA